MDQAQAAHYLKLAADQGNPAARQAFQELVG
jgi:TPR repeat protein